MVSVVLPTFNRMPFLRAAIQSVLAQSFGEWELIVMDDGSTDETASYLEAIADPRVRTLRLEHSGNPARVRNAGIHVARGRFIAFLDSDDEWMPQKLAAQLRLLEGAPPCRWSYTNLCCIDRDGQPTSCPGNPWTPYEGDIVEPLLYAVAGVATPTVMVERALLEEVGGFAESFRCAEDYDLWLKLAQRSPVCVAAAPLARVRVHSDRISRDPVSLHEGWAQLYAHAAASLPDRRLRAWCAARHVERLALVAYHQSVGAQPLAAWRTLWRAAPYGWRRAIWWSTLAKTLVRPLLPSAPRAR